MKNILVAMDLEGKTANLIDNAKELAKKFGSKVWLIHIVEHKRSFAESANNIKFAVQYVNLKDVNDVEYKDEHKMVKAYSDQLIKQGIKSEGLLIEGPNVKIIMDEAKKLKIDLIIIGTHKDSFLYDSLAKSTSNSVLRKSNIPIMVVPL